MASGIALNVSGCCLLIGSWRDVQMDKVVDKGIKIDLHIHSFYSKAKDPDKVMDNTIDNLSVLVNGLLEQQVEMCAITDHDTFNYAIYEKLKEEEKKDNCIKKVLPGIEFSVEFIDSKSIHIVTIFDDTNEDKVRNIEMVMNSEKGRMQKGKQSYTRAEYLEILNEINLDFVMIAHQKKSVTSDTPRTNDVMSLGEDIFNELVFMDYFDAFEFRSKKNEIYNKVYSYDNGIEENLRFITGSDCHRWKYYPYTEKGEKEDFVYTYIKSLPTFKGLAMAITDHHRINISCNFYNPVEHWVNEIHLTIEGEDVCIPMSKGINVIIGDNSIGKSLLLNALTDYQKVHEKGLVPGYKKYLAKNNIEVQTVIPQEQIFMLNRQGEIRNIFDDEGMKPNQYLKQFYPAEIDSKKYRAIVDSEFERLFKALEEKFRFDEQVHKLPTFKLMLEEVESKALSITGKACKQEVKECQELISNLEEVLQKIQGTILKNKVLQASDRQALENIRERIELVKIKYEAELEEWKKQNEKVNVYNTFMSKFKSEYKKKSTSEQILHSACVESVANTVKDISALVQYKEKIHDRAFHIEEVEVRPETNPVDKYQFVSKISVERINNDYLEAVLKSVLKKNHEIRVTAITPEELQNIIAHYNGDEGATPIQVLQEKIKQRLDKDFKVINTVVEENMDVFNKLSAGFDAQTYFTLLSGEERDKGIYLIDQPEDHISQKAIKENVLNQFRRMGGCRQVIMVTHNPQFIVNLDVDNVIYLSKKDGKFKVYSGALEYEDDNCNILQIVADNIEGGLQTILGRMKRYEKNI